MGAGRAKRQRGMEALGDGPWSVPHHGPLASGDGLRDVYKSRLIKLHI